MGLIGKSRPIGESYNSSYIDYDNELSGLTADNVKDALDELAAGGGGGTSLLTKDIDPIDNNYTPLITVGVVRTNTSTGNVIIDLPDSSTFTRTEELFVYQLAGSNSTIINCIGGDTFGGGFTTITCDEQGDFVELRPVEDNRWLANGQTIVYS